MRNRTKILNEEIKKMRHLMNLNNITEQSEWVKMAASGPQKCGKDAAWYKDPSKCKREERSSEGYEGKNPFDSISNYRAYAGEEDQILSDFQRDMNNLPNGVVPEGSNIRRIKNVPPVYIAARRDSQRLTPALKNENYTKYFDQSGNLKPEAESFKNNFEPWFLYYYPYFVGKTSVTPIDILNHFASKGGGIANYEKLVNKFYKK